MKILAYAGFLALCIWTAQNAALSSHVAADTGAKSLFDGKTLDGWVQRGGKAKYTVEEGVIVGTSVAGTPNSFLCTDRDYGDFVLELEFWLEETPKAGDWELNSGVQVRSECFDEDKKVVGTHPDGRPFERKIPAGRVHGYQVEIDPTPRGFTAGIYDEARRGWVYRPEGDEHAEARAAFKPNAWNRLRVEAAGDRIRTWLNGVPVADLRDGMTPKGFIGLQVHGVGDNEKRAGRRVSWRNITLRELSPEEAAASAAEPGHEPLP